MLHLQLTVEWILTVTLRVRIQVTFTVKCAMNSHWDTYSENACHIFYVTWVLTVTRRVWMNVTFTVKCDMDFYWDTYSENECHIYY